MRHLKLFESFNKLPLEENSRKETIEYIESFFVELSDYKDDTYPITVNVYPRAIGRSKYDGYEVHVHFDLYDKGFMEKKIETIKNRLRYEFNIRSNSVEESGEYRTKYVPVHGTDRTTRILDPIYRWSLTLSPKLTNIKESNQQNTNSTLIIVDVQKSFKKWFNEMYVNAVFKYAEKFTDVYQIWDNHHQGKNVDKDYLYDENPEIPVDGDLYTFPNQRGLVEKRYNHNVDVSFYKKILDNDVFNDIYNREKNKSLKKGDIFETNRGTYLVYVNNKHKWHHISKKLYELLSKLKGKNVKIIGGADGECLEDIYVSAESIGVKIDRDWRYIYTASSCPIR